METSILKKSVHGALYLVLLRVLSHGLTFLINTAAIRKIDPLLYGFFAVHLQIVISGILFISREAVRNVCSRVDTSKQEGRDLVTWLSWMVIPFGTVITTVTIACSYLAASAEEIMIPGYTLSVAIAAVAAFLELFTEPAYVYLNLRLQFRGLVFAEGISIFVQSVVTILLVEYAPGTGVAIFAYARLVYTVMLIIGYFVNLRAEIREILPRPGAWRVLRFGLWQTIPFWVQSAAMWLLGEGQRFVLKATLPLADQATFVLVSNLGSLAVRILFRPIEDACHAYFSKHRELGKSEICMRLQQVQRGAVMVAMFFATFGPPYSFILVDTLYSGKYSASNGPALLAAYCFYVGGLALNGVMEAFVRAAADEGSIRRYNRFLIPFTVFHLCAAYVLCLYVGAFGLIAAEYIGVGTRIYFCHRLASNFFSAIDGYSAQGAFPLKKVWAAFFIGAISLHVGPLYFAQRTDSVAYAIWGIFLFIFILVIIFYDECPRGRVIKNNEK